MRERKQNLVEYLLVLVALLILTFICTPLGSPIAGVAIGGGWVIFVAAFSVEIKKLPSSYFLSGKDLPRHPFRVIARVNEESFVIVEDVITGLWYPALIYLEDGSPPKEKEPVFYFYNNEKNKWREIVIEEKE